MDPYDPSDVLPLPSGVPWDKEPDESVDAFLAFAAFLDHPPGHPYPHTAATRRWAHLHHWRSRRAAYVQSLTATATRAAHERAEEIGARHAEMLSTMLDISMEAMTLIRGKDLARSPRDALAYAKTTIELQRLRMGEPGAIVRTDLRGVSDEALADLDAALEAIERENEPVH